MRRLFIVFIIVGFITTIIYLRGGRLKNITTFEQCQDKGYPIAESYPAQCIMPDGRSFVQDIGNELEYIDEIRIKNPRPGQKIKSPLKIYGQARGAWFFEANFSGELYDEKNNLLGVVILMSKGEWMNPDFVPFEGELQFSNPGANKGILKIKNANPSGLAENEKELIIPVRF